MDDGIQHKRTFTSAPGFGFDDAGQRVQVEMPPEPNEPGEAVSDRDVMQIRSEAVARALQWVLEKNGMNSEKVFNYVISSAYLFRCFSSPKGNQELAKALGVSEGRASQITSERRTEWQEILK